MTTKKITKRGDRFKITVYLYYMTCLHTSDKRKTLLMNRIGGYFVADQWWGRHGQNLPPPPQVSRSVLKSSVPSVDYRPKASSFCPPALAENSRPATVQLLHVLINTRHYGNLRHFILLHELLTPNLFKIFQKFGIKAMIFLEITLMSSL